jgi:hypothetical protein
LNFVHNRQLCFLFLNIEIEIGFLNILDGVVRGGGREQLCEISKANLNDKYLTHPRYGTNFRGESREINLNYSSSKSISKKPFFSMTKLVL